MAGIDSRESLHAHLQWALELEHMTIPAYLCALYSLRDGANDGVAAIIRSVVMEEMLHMTLVANILNATGGKPEVAKPGFVPEYPAHLPHSDGKILVQLVPFSPEAIETFLAIEHPAPASAPPEPDRYHTIGQFYEAIDKALVDLTNSLGEGELFSGHASRQVRPEHWYYGGGGDAVVVTNLATARRAIAEIREQGEGRDGTIYDGDEQFGEEKELAHYFRYMEIKTGRRYRPTDTPKSGPTGPELPVDWSAVYRMRPNPKAAEYKDRPDVYRLMTEFNRTYSGLLRLLDKAFNGSPGLLFKAVPAMYRLKYQAQALLKIPSGKGDGTTVGPGFEYVAVEEGAEEDVIESVVR